MRFGDSRVQTHAGALCDARRRHRHHQQEPARPDDRPARRPLRREPGLYDLARLRRNGLITRRPHANPYDLTPDGLTFAIFYIKVHDRVLAPRFTAGQPPAAPPLRAALRIIEHHVDEQFAAARLPTAAEKLGSTVGITDPKGSSHAPSAAAGFGRLRAAGGPPFPDLRGPFVLQGRAGVEQDQVGQGDMCPGFDRLPGPLGQEPRRRSAGVMRPLRFCVMMESCVTCRQTGAEAEAPGRA